MAVTGGSFLDITASDVIGAFLQKEQIEAQSAVDQLRIQGELQNNNLNAAMIGSPSVAVDSGYANRVTGFDASIFSSKWALIGAVVLALTGFTLAVTK